jgi:membrane glycosyltransferase
MLFDLGEPLGGMPPAAPLHMPPQNLRYPVAEVHQWRSPFSVILARLLLFAITVGITAYGSYEMLDAVRFAKMTFLQGLMIVFFVVTLNWIGFAAGTALVGLVKKREFSPPADFSTGEARTALIMPIYNEDPTNVTAALQAMAEELRDCSAKEHFEMVLLSDSTSADAWVRESVALMRLRAAIPFMPVWYRRRWQNIARKAGNVEDFVEKWGGRYDYMIVLDADSLIDAATLVGLVRKMHADPQMGILQSAPTLINATTLFARLQQFASRVYGPVIARGMAAWSGDSCNYWGHNAIIRVQAFAQNCGLPSLPGRKPFGGFILSHDFVEAALIRRAGWKVHLATDLHGSYEECPPTLTDLAVRDRRWAQGNLQHSKVIGTAGLSWLSRLHMAVGIMSYVSSPLWLVLLCVGFALSLQSHLIRPEYFTRDFQLFPTWPRFDAQLMLDLFLFSMFVLLIPKMLGLIRAIFNNPIRRATRGIIGLIVSAAVELVLSALYAPILMLTQSTHVFEVLLGRDSGWGAQRRAVSDSTWRDAWHSYRKHTIIGIVTAVIAWFLSPSLFAWMSPALAGLLLSVPLSRASGSATLGRVLAVLGILRTPEEAHPPRLVARKRELIEQSEPLPEDGLLHLARNRDARLAHIQSNVARPADPRGKPDPNVLTAEQKIEDAANLDELLQWLTREERVHGAGSAAMLHQMAGLPELPKSPPI